MDIDVVRGELERLFSLEELVRVSADLLGLDPEEVGGTATKASFARALASRCAETDALDALLDVVAASGKDLDPRLRDAGASAFSVDEELGPEQSIGPYAVVRKLGEGPIGVVYVGKLDGEEYRVKVLRREAARDPRARARYLALSRLIGTVDHDGLPRKVSAGTFGGGRWYVAHAHVEGQPLAARIARTGPMHVNEARPFLRSLLEALLALHERRIAHGNLKLDNVVFVRGADGVQRAHVLDPACDRLRVRPAAGDGPADLIAVGAAARACAPEQLRGKLGDPRSDLYAFGAMLFEIVTGKPVFAAPGAVDAAVAHLVRAPDPPSGVAPRGWVSKDLDRFVLDLLAKDPAARPKDARAVLEALESFGRTAAAKAAPALSPEEVDGRIDALVADPTDEKAALALEAAVEQGADAAKVAEAFVMAADQMETGDDAEKKEAKKLLLFRAARIFENAKNYEKAEQAYQWITELDPQDDIAVVALEDIRKAQGKYEELIEMLLARSEKAESRAERARAMAEIGRIYATEVGDKQQAVIAYAQAFCEDVKKPEYADEVERLAGSDTALINEAVSMCANAARGKLPPEVKNPILVRLGGWYDARLHRQDLALQCFQAVLATEPANDAAAAGIVAVYRKAQQWPELAQGLLHRADAAPTPTRARELRFEAAEIFETKLNDAGRARDLYQQILDEDPGHARAAEALTRAVERAGDFKALVRIVEGRADTLRGAEKCAALVRIAEIAEDRLNDLPEAVRRLESVLAIDPRNLTALKALDRIYSRQGKYKELLEVLDREIAIAATPRQKITLWERVAAIWDEEFLNHEKAAAAWEAVLEIDAAHDAALGAVARHYRALDRWEDAQAAYERHLKYVTDDARRLELLLARGRILADQIGSPERATKVYDQVLEINPEHPAALEALAHLRESTGDATAALSAIEALAQQATTAEGKAEQWIRAARLLESRGDRDGAIERFKLALDASPRDPIAFAALRAAYAARGDAAAAIELIVREVAIVEGNLQKARLFAEMARLARDRLKDDERAASAAKRANELDPTNIPALVLLGDIAFGNERYVEAAHWYGELASRVEAMPKEEATRVLVHYVDALGKTGSTEKALQPVDALLRLAPDDGDAIARVARVTFDHGAPERAWELYRDLVARFGDALVGARKVDALWHLGEAARRAGKLEEAIAPLTEASELDPGASDALVSLARVYEAREDWENVVKVKNRRLELATGDERSDLLLEVGEILAGKLGDRTRAAKMYVAALEERPDDRKLLTKLMQLYSEEKDWSKLVDVVLRLAEFVDDPKQKAKYIHTAAIVTGKQVGDVDKALGYYDQVLQLDPTLEKALAEAIELRREKGDHPGTEKLLKIKLERASAANDHAKLLETFVQLGVLYHKHLGWTSEAIDAYEAAQTLEPDNRERNELLAELYASDPAQYLEKAVHAQRAILRQNPYKAESYKLLRRLYTESKRADPSWCLCQALYVLNMAEPDEERFFRRFRSENAAAAQARLTNEEWAVHLVHEDADPLLTAIFATIEPAILAARAAPLEALGYDRRYVLDLSMHPYPISQTLYYAIGTLGMDPPPTFQNVNDPGGLSFLHAQPPAIVLGMAALQAEIPTQAAAFIAARHLTYYRPGLYVRHLVPTGTGLKAWLFAAIKMSAPQFPVPADLEGQVQENLAALSAYVVGPTRDTLASFVSKLLQSGGALDLKRWVAAVDLTADRAGFVLAHDLEVATEIIKASDEASAAVSNKDRQKELVLFSTSERYFALRQFLGVGIDA